MENKSIGFLRLALNVIHIFAETIKSQEKARKLIKQVLTHFCKRFIYQRSSIRQKLRYTRTKLFE